jgi:hypothetical protein
VASSPPGNQRVNCDPSYGARSEIAFTSQPFSNRAMPGNGRDHLVWSKILLVAFFVDCAAKAASPSVGVGRGAADERQRGPMVVAPHGERYRPKPMDACAT